MYCNSCMLTIKKDEVTYCEQCGVPLHKDCANRCLTCGKVLCDDCFVENNYKCEECYKPENKFSVIRRSHLEQYAGCPYSLYLQLVCGEEPPMGAAAELGILVHQIIEEMPEFNLTLADAKEMLSKRVKEWNELPETEEYSYVTEELLNNGYVCLENFYLIKDSFPSEYLTEHNIKFSIDDDLPKISCTLDRIVQVNNEIHIHDWKTGKPMSGKKLVTDLQPPLYIYGVYKEFGKMPDTFTLHYLRTNKVLTYFKIDDDNYEVKTSRASYILNIPEALERAKAILLGIRDNHFNIPDEKTHQWRCKSFCWFGISGRCSNAFNEQWKVLSEKHKED